MGGRAYGFELCRELQERGFETYAGRHGARGSEQASPGRGLSAYDVEATGEALVGFLERRDGRGSGGRRRARVRLANASALAAKKPELFRRIVVMNAPLVASHAYPPQMATYTRPFVWVDLLDAAGPGGNGRVRDPADVMGEYEQPYIGEERKRRAAVGGGDHGDGKN